MTPALRWAAMRAIFNVLLIVRDKATRQCPQTTSFEGRAEAESNRCPSVYQPNVLPLGQTGSSVKQALRMKACTLSVKVDSQHEPTPSDGRGEAGDGRKGANTHTLSADFIWPVNEWSFWPCPRPVSSHWCLSIRTACVRACLAKIIFSSDGFGVGFFTTLRC